MDALAVLAGGLLPWWLGIAFLLALRPMKNGEPGELAWVCGSGYLAGAFVLTLWMRALSLANVKFAVMPIALPRPRSPFSSAWSMKCRCPMKLTRSMPGVPSATPAQERSRAIWRWSRRSRRVLWWR